MAELQAKIVEWFIAVQERFVFNFIEDDRWKYLWNGLGVTLKITFFALVLGVAIGCVVAIIRASHDKNIKEMSKWFPRILLKFMNALCKFYLTVIRGTPVVVQLLIMVFAIMPAHDPVFVAIITFGINSGAYVAEIVRSGIMSIDAGQFEAGRSLGFNYIQTMRHIILPQALKNVLPALANEFIVLLKETSIAGYAGIGDLTKGGNIIIGRTYDGMFPYLALAIMYLSLVMLFTWLVGILERRLRNSER